MDILCSYEKCNELNSIVKHAKSICTETVLERYIYRHIADSVLYARMFKMIIILSRLIDNGTSQSQLNFDT